jgi:hypothetical protein
MQYNVQLGCIDAFLVYGNSMTVFAKIIGDSLKTFATVENYSGFHIVSMVGRNGHIKRVSREKSTDYHVRFRSFEPLQAYDLESSYCQY